MSGAVPADAPAALVEVSVLPSLAPRSADSHKGDFGRVLVVGGSVGMVGAPALAANAAMRSGAGLVTVAVPMVVQQAVATLCPTCTSFPLPQSNIGTLSSSAAAVLRSLMERCDVLALGPGLGKHLDLRDVLREALAQEDRPVVLDADGLNTLAEQDDWWPLLPATVLTPHPGEMRRLLASAKLVGDLGSDDGSRRQLAVALARKANAVVLLKGHQTVITDGRRVRVNLTGNPGLAKGGTGDVLTGVVAGLIAQGLGPFDAACLAAHVHGLAGDDAAERLTSIGMTASDVVDALPSAWRALAAALPASA